MKLKQIPVRDNKGNQTTLGSLSKNQLIRLIMQQKQEIDRLRITFAPPKDISHDMEDK